MKLSPLKFADVKCSINCNLVRKAQLVYEGDSICNDIALITLPAYALELYTLIRN